MASGGVHMLMQVWFLVTIGFVRGQRGGDVKFLSYDGPSKSPYEGVVQVFHRERWGGICASVVELADASVLCKTMGYQMATRSEPARNNFPDHQNNAVSINSLHCVGSEVEVNDCSVGWTTPGFATTCSNDDVIAIACSPMKDYSIRLMGGASWYEGRVEIYHGSGGHDHWGTVCNDYWGKPDAKVVCRQLQYENPELAREKDGDIYRAGSDGMFAFLDDVQCVGTESSLAECASKSWHSTNCVSNFELAAVICDPADHTGYLSTGAIVSIVIGSLFVLFCAGVLLIICCKKQQRKKRRGHIAGPVVAGGSGITYINQGATGGIVFISPGQQQASYATPPGPPAYSPPGYDPGKGPSTDGANL